MVHRTRIRLAGDILECTRQDASMAEIKRRASVSQHRIAPTLHALLSQGLMEQVNSDRYRTSPKGRDFLREYSIFRESSERLGVAL